MKTFSHHPMRRQPSSWLQKISASSPVTRRQVVGLGLSLMATALALLPSTSLPGAWAADVKGASKTLNIGFQKSSTLNLVRARGDLAKQLAKQGYSINWAEFTSGPPLLEALATGKVDIGETGDAPPVFAQSKGAQLVYIGQTQPNPEAVGLLVAADSQITNPSQLRGHRVAFAKGSSAHYFVVKLLASANLKLSDITPVYLQPPDARVAFESGKIEAWAIWDPFFAAAQKGTSGRLLSNGRGYTPYRGFILASKPFATDNPNAIAVVLKQLRASGDWALQNPQRTAEFLSEATKIPVEVLEVSERRRNGRYKVTPIQLDGIRDQQKVADLFEEVGLIPQKIQVSDIVYKSAK